MAPKLTQTVYSECIFHGLPTFPAHDAKKYTVIVTRATGISGSEILSVLAAAPERWETIYAMSRRAPNSHGAHVKHVAADFLSTPEKRSELFKEEEMEKVDYIFFASYIQPPDQEGGIWSNTDELEKVNGSSQHPLSRSHLTHISHYLLKLPLSTGPHHPHPKAFPPPNRRKALRPAPRTNHNPHGRRYNPHPRPTRQFLLPTRRPPLRLVQQAQFKLRHHAPWLHPRR